MYILVNTPTTSDCYSTLITGHFTNAYRCYPSRQRDFSIAGDEASDRVDKTSCHTRGESIARASSLSIAAAFLRGRGRIPESRHVTMFEGRVDNWPLT